ncbi:MAG: uracil-DNA glycosylase family protein [Sphingomicrobium sp.]
MGGTGTANGTREVTSALRWWLETGVDVAIQENPRNWLEGAKTLELAQAEARAPSPNTLETFREWLSSSPDAPLASAQSRAVLPQGAQGAQVMILSDPPSRDELASGQPIGGLAAELMQRMLAAIGMAGQAYTANLACFRSPAARLSSAQMEECASAARRHVELARPRRLLLLGDAPSRTLLGKPLLEARGHVHKIEGVRTIATFHPRQLLKRPSDKALAWKDLLLLIEETS